MARYTGGSKVPGGYYWNPRGWSVEVVPSQGGRLPAVEANFVRVPFPLALLIVPILGAVFLVFLPLIGFGLFAYAIGKRLGGGVKRHATELASTVQPGWVAGEAHLTGKPGEEKKGEAKAPPELEKLEKEIEAARKKE
jgi:hypothetical protein